MVLVEVYFYCPGLAKLVDSPDCTLCLLCIQETGEALGIGNLCLPQ